MLVQGKDGELRINDHGNSGTTYYIQVLFTAMDFTGPTSRTRTEETMIMNRGIFDSDAHFIEGNDEPRYAPLPITFSCKLADTVDTRALSDWVSGVTKLAGTTQLYTRKGKTNIDGTNTLPNFADSTGKYAYTAEIIWKPSSVSLGYQYEEVYFTPGEQTVTEAEDGVTLSCSGQVYGSISRVTAFSTGYTVI